MTYAGKLLNKYKRKLLNASTLREYSSTESSLINNKVPEINNVSEVLELKLTDQCNECYTLFVDKETYNRAKKDLCFAMNLLNIYKKVINEQNENSEAAPQFPQEENIEPGRSFSHNLRNNIYENDENGNDENYENENDESKDVNENDEN